MPDKTVFLSHASGELRSELKAMMRLAGISVISPEEERNPLIRNASMLDKADCSFHILDPFDISETSISTTREEFLLAKKQAETRPGFRIFIWQIKPMHSDHSDSKQASLIHEIRNSITSNMVYTEATSMIRLVEDLRSLLDSKEKAIYETKSADVFLIFNQLDESEAAEIIDILSDIVPVEKLCIIQDSAEDYAGLCSQQVAVSKLAVIYYKYSSQWAVPFTQQIWKKTGGASSHTPILLIGDEVPEENKMIRVNMPKIICLIVAGELIPLEIKVLYDKVNDID